MEKAELEKVIVEKTIRTKSGCRVWRGRLDYRGYARLNVNGKDKIVSRLVAVFWLGLNEQNKKSLACHRCDNPPCVEAGHLFVGSMKDNIRDAVKKGRMADKKGNANGRAKLNASIVRELRRRREKGLPVNHLAKKYGVARQTISYAANGHNWKHI